MLSEGNVAHVARERTLRGDSGECAVLVFRPNTCAYTQVKIPGTQEDVYDMFH